VGRRRREPSLEERFLRTGAVEPERHRRGAVPSFVRLVVAGLARFAVMVAVAAAVAGGVGLLFGHLRGGDPERWLTLGLYLGGALLIVGALITGGRERRYVGDLGEDLGSSGAGAPAFVAVGVALICLGIAAETYLR
jgi:hypothetical protein